MNGSRGRVIAGAVALALLLSGCGTRVSSGSATVPVTRAEASGASPAYIVDPEPVARDVGPGSGPPAGTSRAAPAPTASSRTPAAASRTEAAAGDGPRARPETPRAVTEPNGSSLSGPEAGPDAPRRPLVVGQVGTFSGPVGSAVHEAVTAVRVWARSVNDRGGLNGHPVVVISADDGGDPARSKAIVRDLVEHRNVLALVADFSAITRSAHSQYLLEHRIPVIGGDLATPEWYSSPMYFSVGPWVRVVIYGILSAAAERGARNLAFLYCAEVPECGEQAAFVRQWAGDVGLGVKYEARISVAQPDYTAECLSARSRGADAILVSADTSTVGRIAAACSRQNYNPLYLTGHVVQADLMTGFPGLDGGMVGAQAVFPWFLENETPGIREYASTMARYAPNARPGGDVAIGWASAKLLEKAAAGIGPEPATDQILRGLWSLRQETLDGLTVPLTFTEGSAASKGSCWFVTGITDGRWAAPHGGAPTCADRVF